MAMSTERPAFESACGVFDKKTGISQSGVLITPWIIATAAHGIVDIVGKISLDSDETTIVPVKSVTAHFSKNGHSYSCDVASVMIDSRYLSNNFGGQAKYDIAFLKLQNPIYQIQATPLFHHGQISGDLPLYVVTFGNADCPNKPLEKRAFMLCELDTYYANSLDGDSLAFSRSLLLSSLFFKPKDCVSDPGIHGDELAQRTYEANKNWVKNGKKPYALALPGTSGAPVYVTLTENGQQKDYVLGVITSFAHLSGFPQAKHGQSEHSYILNAPRDKITGAYQTILALFYRENTQRIEKKGNSVLKTYEPDPLFFKMLSKLSTFERI